MYPTHIRAAAAVGPRLDEAAVRRMFPSEQIALWPEGYRPACGVAHFIQPGGVQVADIIECYRGVRDNREKELQRDFAADYTMWCRAALCEFIRRLRDRDIRRMRRFTARERTIHDSDVRELFGLPPYAPPRPAATSSSLSTTTTAETTSSGKRYYEFTPYAAMQEYVMMPISRCTSPNERVHFATFPQIRNVMHTEFDGMGPLRAMTMLTGDELQPTAEFLQNLAFYLRHRVGEIIEGEEAFKRTAITAAIDGGNINNPLQGGTSPSFSTETPVVCFFGNGRLAWLLNNSELLPFPVLPVQTPAQAASRERRQKSLLAQHGLLPDLVRDGAVANSISTVFPCETMSVADALRKYRPCIAVVEPHVDRDWLCDIRGFYSMREVLTLGPVDSPAMGSFTFPFLSFGVTPGPTTYWTYSDTLQRVTHASRIQMPMDPPHVAQGYTRRELDTISAHMISPNDCQAFGSHHRCLSFVRTLYPVMSRQPMHSTGPTSGATPT
ncbi:uncharacterized protein TM35_000182130 [Trypanosoma theileri]|uniref:Uncharacterized protein n=1 Tax=Trypanosoma theileri TaxID=67003 RepID=A0A1X0NTX1_9TRYP|nr:uncharacterized protein TM35_000182130 [Trypanosoma theileri]ORC88156.1 hypothetical protein TM35_000182130 [Trypanosoma theileri]